MFRALSRFVFGFLVGVVYTYLIWTGAVNMIMGHSVFGGVMLFIGIGIAVAWWAYIWEHTESFEIKKWKK